MAEFEKLPTEYQQYIFLSRYARYDWDKGRRETWNESVARYFDFFESHIEEQHGEDALKAYQKERPNLEKQVLTLQNMPSMRALMTAGKALSRDHVASFNCSFLAITSPRDFDELMYILLNGTGVGFSVERQFVNKLPEVAEEFNETDTTIVVSDSKIGWASAFRELLSLLWAGKIPKWDVSKVRPAGAPLKTFGGRASGPAPLEDLFNFSIDLFKKAKGRKLTSIECHDLVCKVADIVVVGGVRRSALLSGSNLSDDRMRKAKNGQWWIDNPQRALANNSAVYTEKPEFEVFMQEWLSLYESKSGERGIFSRVGAQKHVERHGRRDHNWEFLSNPCGEIILRDKQFCNLSTVIIDPSDGVNELKKKIEVATILGTMQSTLTDFRYLRKKWKDNCDEERLLGVSMTGIMDNPLTNGSTGKLESVLDELREHAIKVNKKWADILGIQVSTAISTIKPEGTVSQLTNTASGIHPRFAPYYIRTIRADKKDPLAQFMIDKGFPYEEDVMNASNYVFSFPIKSPDNSITGDDITAMERLDIWEKYREHYTEHNPSVTVEYSDDEFLEVGNWVWNKFDKITGLSFLPKTDHVYKQAPYQKITEEEYYEFLERMPKNVDWSELVNYESGDQTEGRQELSCSAGACEI